MRNFAFRSSAPLGATATSHRVSLESARQPSLHVMSAPGAIEPAAFAEAFDDGLAWLWLDRIDGDPASLVHLLFDSFALDAMPADPPGRQLQSRYAGCGQALADRGRRTLVLHNGEHLASTTVELLEEHLVPSMGAGARLVVVHEQGPPPAARPGRAVLDVRVPLDGRAASALAARLGVWVSPRTIRRLARLADGRGGVIGSVLLAGSWMSPGWLQRLLDETTGLHELLTGVAAAALTDVLPETIAVVGLVALVGCTHPHLVRAVLGRDLTLTVRGSARSRVAGGASIRCGAPRWWTWSCGNRRRCRASGSGPTPASSSRRARPSARFRRPVGGAYRIATSTIVRLNLRSLDDDERLTWLDRAEESAVVLGSELMRRGHW